MNEEEIYNYIMDNFADTKVTVAGSRTFFSYDPEQKFPFTTLVTSDEFDNASDLGRPGIYRLNIGISKATFRELFGAPSFEADGRAPGYDYTTLDQFMPHPIYGRMYWICVLNPSGETFAQVKTLLGEAYELDVKRHTKPPKASAAGDLPDSLSNPARRALIAAGINNLAQLAQVSEKEVLALHGVGPKSIPTLKSALAEQGLDFAAENSRG